MMLFTIILNSKTGNLHTYMYVDYVFQKLFILVTQHLHMQFFLWYWNIVLSAFLLPFSSIKPWENSGLKKKEIPQVLK